MSARTHGDELGLTLTELTVAMVLAALVMGGLVGFYLNSQALWMDGSSQAIAQREVAMTVGAIAARARGAKRAWVTTSAPQDPRHARLQLVMPGALATYDYWWSSADSLLHEGWAGTDRGPMLDTPVELFRVSADSFKVTLDTLVVHSAQGRRIGARAAAAFMNR